MNKIEEKAVDYLQLVKRMIDVIAHDVRNPLNNILLSTAQFKMGTLPDKEDTAFYVDIIERSCERINTLLSDIAGKVHQPGISPEAVNVTALLEELLGEFEERFAIKGITSKAALGRNVIASFDQEQVKQAISHLLENAIEAMPDGGTVDVSVKEENGELSIMIRDFGAGIKSEVLPYIFVPFFTTKERHKGLGLTLVKNVMDAHLGKVTIVSSAEGTTASLIINP